jgi:hypothetical protein
MNEKQAGVERRRPFLWGHNLYGRHWRRHTGAMSKPLPKQLFTLFSLVLLAAAGPAPVAPKAAAAPKAAPPKAPAKAKPAPKVEKGPLLTGAWAGDHAALRTLDDGATVQNDCSHGKISGQIHLGPGGTFKAKGYYNAPLTGYRVSDIASRDHPADFTGKVSGDVLTLSISVLHESNTHEFKMRRNARIKFPECQ